MSKSNPSITKTNRNPIGYGGTNDEAIDTAHALARGSGAGIVPSGPVISLAELRAEFDRRLARLERKLDELLVEKRMVSAGSRKTSNIPRT